MWDDNDLVHCRLPVLRAGTMWQWQGATRVSCTACRRWQVHADFFKKAASANAGRPPAANLGYVPAFIVPRAPRRSGTILIYRDLSREMPGAPLVTGCVQHVDTLGVYVLGHLKHPVEFVVQVRLASGSRQRIVTRIGSSCMCTHHEYWYTPALSVRKCADLTITCPQRSHPGPPFVYPAGYSSFQAPAICNKTGGER